MSQSHGILATTQLPAASAVTWLNGLGSRFSLIPSASALDCSWVISASVQADPVAYGKLKFSAVPAVIPGPHRLGVAQVVVPPGTTVQPWLVSRLLALAGLYGNGSPALLWGDRNGVTGLLPTGPTVTVP